MKINETANLSTIGERIESACFFDGNEDEYVIQFFYLGGSIIRCQYNRRDTTLQTTFINVHGWEYRELFKMYEGERANYCI